MKLSGRRITVLGDVMLDEHIHGAVNRVSPEAPVPVVQVTSRTHHPGGAANVAMNIAALGGDVRLCGVCGSDEGSQILRERLQCNISAEGVVESGARCTSRKTRVLAHGHHHIVRFDEEVTSPLDEAEAKQLWTALEPSLLASDALVLSDYAKGVLTAAVCARAIALAMERGIPVVVDPKDSDFSKYRGATVVTPNFGEAVAAARRRDPLIGADESNATAERIASLLQRTYGCSLVLTRGARGMTVLDRSANTPLHIPAVARRVYDVTGAGDTVVAVLALGLAAGFPLSEAAAMSNEAAGLVIQLPGTAVVTLEELIERGDGR
jgi:rfaE bifunctional protein kinase chain/domain